MLAKVHYELIVKYTSGNDVQFNAEELATVYSLLNLHRPHGSFSEHLLESYLIELSVAVQNQTKIMTELCGEFAQVLNDASEIAAYRYLLEHLGEIISPFMLDNIIGVVVAIRKA